MDEKQKKQIEIIANTLSSEEFTKLDEIHVALRDLGRSILKDLTAFDVVSGHSEKMLAANAIMQIDAQIMLILTAGNE